MSAKQPTDYIRAYSLARKLAAKRLKRINELRKALYDLVGIFDGIAIGLHSPYNDWTKEAKIALKNSEKRI